MIRTLAPCIGSFCLILLSHYHWWTATIKPRLLFSPCKLWFPLYSDWFKTRKNKIGVIFHYSFHVYSLYWNAIISYVFSVCGLCKWANEICAADDECCSGRCDELHPGAEPRCGNSRLYFPCIFDFQCEGGLACGENYSCCSPFWGVCTQTKDCCDPEFVCREETGFIYKRCLKSSTITIVPQIHVLLMCTLVIYIIGYTLIVQTVDTNFFLLRLWW